MMPSGEFVAPKTSNMCGRADYMPPKVYRRETPNIPSLESKEHFVAKIEPMRYTGTLVKGLATMHKSNIIPVIDDDHAKDLARMRR